VEMLNLRIRPAAAEPLYLRARYADEPDGR
jgi:hypothetical protein